MLTIGQRWRSSTPGSLRKEILIVEVIEIFQDCRSAKVKVVETDCTTGTFYVGQIYTTNAMPLHGKHNKFWEYLEGQEAPEPPKAISGRAPNLDWNMTVLYWNGSGWVGGSSGWSEV